jgi:hypothetical protein
LLFELYCVAYLSNICWCCLSVFVICYCMK